MNGTIVRDCHVVRSGGIVAGQIVRSKAGRDAGRFFVALAVEGEYAVLADGKVRRLAAPKRKKLRHLAPTARVVENIGDGAWTDKRLRKLLTEYAPDGTEQGTGGNALVKE